MSRYGDTAGEAADCSFRHNGAKVVATLTAHLGTHRLQLAEDLVQEALLRAFQMWSYRGVQDNPAAWLTHVAKNPALNALQREQPWNENGKASPPGTTRGRKHSTVTNHDPSTIARHDCNGFAVRRIGRRSRR